MKEPWIVGFSLLIGDDPKCAERMLRAQDKVLNKFPWLQLHRLELPGIPGMKGCIWGIGDLSSSVVAASDGSTLIFRTGTPWGDKDHYREWAKLLDKPEIGWHGIWNFIVVMADKVIVRNDWTGACRLFWYADKCTVCISTLEPVVFDVSGISADAMDPVGLYSLLSCGHYFGAMTLYSQIKVQPPDTVCEYSLISGVRTERVWSVKSSQEYWASGWQEIVDKWGDLFESRFAQAFDAMHPDVLMLSGGLDSRLIAAIAQKLGLDLLTVTYGNKTWQDGIQARFVAQALGLKNSIMPIDDTYLEKYTKRWCEWFGSSLHVHGMYQFPALERLREQGVAGPIATGFIGDPLEGMQISALMEGPVNISLLERLWRKLHFWSDSEIRDLVPWLDVNAAKESIESSLRTDFDSIDGAPYQKMWFVFHWNHVFPFSSYQPTMYEYYLGVATPFADSVLANFSMSLPRIALEGRRAFYELVKQRYPIVAALPGTFSHPSPIFSNVPSRFGIPLLLTPEYMALAAVGSLMPKWLRVGPFRQFNPTRNRFALDAIKRHGRRALYPLDRECRGLWEVLRRPVVDTMIRDLESGHSDLSSVAKINGIQTIAYRLGALN